MEVRFTRSKFCTRFSMDFDISIGIKCILCRDILLAPVECIQFFPTNLPEMLETVLGHVRCHLNVHEVREFSTILDNDKCYDVNHYFEGSFYLFRTLL